MSQSVNSILQSEMTKLQVYEGNVIPFIHAPTTFTKWRYGCRKLLKIWFRLDKAKLHWKPLVNTLKTISEFYIDIGRKLYARNLLIDILSERLYLLTLESFISKEFESSDELTEEKMRVHKSIKGVNCSICDTLLINPAYIIYRDAKGHIKGRSKPIGIMCLNSSLNRLTKLISTVEFKDLLVQTNLIVGGSI